MVRVSGLFRCSQTCPQVPRQRQEIAAPLQDLSRRGVSKSKTLEVKIPAGVDTDDRIRLSGEGEAGTNGGPSGDLYVVVQMPHAVFQRDAADLHCRDADFVRHFAALGGELEIPTLGWQALLKIPSETQSVRCSASRTRVSARYAAA